VFSNYLRNKLDKDNKMRGRISCQQIFTYMYDYIVGHPSVWPIIAKANTFLT